MKKYLVLLIPFLLTGCFGLAGSGNLSVTCTKDEYSANLTENKKYVIDFSKGNITKVTYIDSFISDSIDMSNAIKSYQKAYQNEKGVTISIKDNSITYEFVINDISDNVMKEFNLSNKYNDQVKKLKESGFVCK